MIGRGLPWNPARWKRFPAPNYAAVHAYGNRGYNKPFQPSKQFARTPLTPGLLLPAAVWLTLRYMRIAFKEWAIVVDALASGTQIILLRKGGVSEGRRGFQVEHAEFLLFPTRFHEQSDSLIPSAQARLDQVEAELGDGAEVRLQWYAHVVSWRRVDSLASIERLRGQHIWRDEVITKRFDWGKEKNIFALAVRVFKLPSAVQIPVLPSYAGCKSWINLELDVLADGATPVLSKEAFNDKLVQFHAALDHGDPSPAAAEPS
jgi:hypothetical protein